MPTSKLFWNEDEKQLEVEVTNSKKVTKKISCPANQLAPNVPRIVSETDNIEVDFDRDQYGNILKIRLKGELWQGATEPEKRLDYQGEKRKAVEKSKEDRRFNKPYPDKSREMSKEIIDMPKDFHNPYNFVPAIPRDKATGDLRDLEPLGHDRYLSEMLSGKLTVKMRVETPLLLPDTARMIYTNDKDRNIKEHKSYPVRVGADDKPYINPTAVKGMLRSAYEAVTNSRLSVFTKHDNRLAFRPEAKEGAFVVPVRIEEENNVKKVVFYTGTNETTDLKNDGCPQNGKPLCAAWLPRYKKNKNNQVVNYTDGGSPEHKDEVDVWIEKFKHYKWKWINKRDGFGKLTCDFAFWRVREVVRKGEALGSPPKATFNIGLDKAKELKKSYYESTGTVEKATGHVFVSNHNMQSKHDEKIFFKNSNSPNPDILSDERWSELKSAWKELIENYRAEHEKVKGKLEPVSEKLGISEWSRHIQLSEKEKELKPDMLCFAEVEKSGNDFIVKRLFPVMISRQLFDCSPFELLQKDLQGKDLHLTPAKLITQFSPADRVFGWVRQGKTKDELTAEEKTLSKKVKEIGAYRGQIRFGEVKTESTHAIEDFGEDWLPLNILGQPKPQQGRFYVAETINGEAQVQNENRNNKEAGYEQGRGLRGRKIYPHQNSLPDNYWIVEESLKKLPKPPFSQQELKGKGDKSFFREYIRLSGEKQRDNQNRSVQGWVRKDTVFEFDIHFINLSKAELGALIWLLSLNDENENRYFHRFGGGKPFGFGSVRLELGENEIFNGNQLKKRYFSLEPENEEGKPQSTNVKTFVEAFQKAVLTAYKPAEEIYDEQIKKEFEKISFIAAFKRASEGYKNKDNEQTNLPVHYPRESNKPYKHNSHGNDEKVVNESFRWFVKNNTSAKLSLPDLTADEGFPYFKGDD